MPGEGTAFWIEGSGDDAVKRWLGCLLVAFMPEAGLNEALVLLKDAREFYSAEVFPSLPGPTVRGEMSGTFLPKAERPPLALED